MNCPPRSECRITSLSRSREMASRNFRGSPDSVIPFNPPPWSGVDVRNEALTGWRVPPSAFGKRAGTSAPVWPAPSPIQGSEGARSPVQLGEATFERPLGHADPACQILTPGGCGALHRGDGAEAARTSKGTLNRGVPGMRTADAGARIVITDVQPGKGARLGLVAEAGVDRIGTFATSLKAPISRRRWNVSVGNPPTPGETT